MSDVNMHIARPAAWIEVEGEDGFTFLQGQFTNDLRRPGPSPVTYGLWLDRKGKVIADSFLLREAEDRFYLYSYHSPASVIIDRLEPYIIADDVTLRDLTGSTSAITLWGEGLDDVLIHCGLERPDQGAFFHQDHRFLFRGRRSRSPNIELVVTGDDNEQMRATLSAAVKDAGGALMDEAAVERERIEAGIPSIPRDVGSSDLPQEGNLAEDAISYTKGCYLGQEVMARIRAMGKVRRTLVQVRLNGEVPPLPAPLYDGEREVGILRTTAGPLPSLGLALVKIDVLAKSPVLAPGPNKPPSIEILR